MTWVMTLRGRMARLPYRLVLFAVAVWGFCLVVSCNPDKQQRSAASSATEQTQKLKEEVDSLRHDLDSKIIDLDLLELRVDELESAMAGNTPVEISLVQETYSPVKTPDGTLFILCHEVTPYLNGHKLKLWIGNPLFARLSGLKLTYEYGLKAPDFGVIAVAKGREARRRAWKQYDEAGKKHRQSLHSGAIDLPQDLESGRWTEVELALVSSTAEELGHVNVHIFPKAVHLIDPPNPSASGR